MRRFGVLHYLSIVAVLSTWALVAPAFPQHATLTAPGSISGLTANTIPKATSATTIGNSSCVDDGTTVICTNPLQSPSGSVGAPGLAVGVAGRGFYAPAAGALNYIQNGSTPEAGFFPGGFGFPSTGALTWASGSAVHTGLDLLLVRDSAASLQLGQNSATPVSQTIKAANGSGTDIAGGSLTVAAGKSTGAGIGGDVVTQTSPSGATGAALNTLGDRSRVLAKYTTLTQSVATAFARIAIASGTVIGGEVVVTAEANNGTDFQARTLRFGFTAVNKAGVTTAAIDTPSESVAVSLGTLTCTITTADATNNVDLKANCTSSLTPTVFRANAVVAAKNFGVGAISAQ